MEEPRQEPQPGETTEDKPPDTTEDKPPDTTEDRPPDTSEHPSHEEEVGGKGAEDPAEMADEDRYRKGPGW